MWIQSRGIFFFTHCPNFSIISWTLVFIPLSIYLIFFSPCRKFDRWWWTGDSKLQTWGHRPSGAADQLQQERAAGSLPRIQKCQSKSPADLPLFKILDKTFYILLRIDLIMCVSSLRSVPVVWWMKRLLKPSTHSFSLREVSHESMCWFYCAVCYFCVKLCVSDASHTLLLLKIGFLHLWNDLTYLPCWWNVSDPFSQFRPQQFSLIVSLLLW